MAIFSKRTWEEAKHALMAKLPSLPAEQQKDLLDSIAQKEIAMEDSYSSTIASNLAQSMTAAKQNAYAQAMAITTGTSALGGFGSVLGGNALNSSIHSPFGGPLSSPNRSHSYNNTYPPGYTYGPINDALQATQLDNVALVATWNAKFNGSWVEETAMEKETFYAAILIVAAERKLVEWSNVYGSDGIARRAVRIVEAPST